MTIDTITHGVLFAGALATSYVVLREYDAQENGRPTRRTTLEVGSLFSALLWAVVSLTSFNISTSSTTTTQTGVAFLGAAAGIVMGLVFVGSVLSNVVPDERSVLEGSRR